MAEERGESVDFWEELEEAERTVERWPAWQQRYDVGLPEGDECEFPEARAIARPVTGRSFPAFSGVVF